MSALQTLLTGFKLRLRRRLENPRLESTPWILDSRYWVPLFVGGTSIPDSNR